MRRSFKRPMLRHTLCLPALSLPLLVVACGNYAGQNGLDASPDGYIPIPVYEAGPPRVFDGSFDARDASGEGSKEGAADAPADVPAEATKEGAVDGPSEGATDALPDGPRDGSGPG